MNEDVKRFLDELTQLTLKHKIAIGGCGCCNSPWLEFTETKEEFDPPHYSDKLIWDYDENMYIFD